MSTVQMEYPMLASWLVSGIAWALMEVLSLPNKTVVVTLLLAATYVAYSYSPLPQGGHRPNHKKRKRKWGFSVEYEDGPQKTLNEYGETNGE